MGIDLELADCAAAGSRMQVCGRAGPACEHDPDCEADYYRLLARVAAARPGESPPAEFRYRRFEDINRTMLLTGMGYVAKSQPWTHPDADPGDERAQRERDEADLRWRSQTAPGRTGIPTFKLESNDMWIVTVREIEEALAAYAKVPAAQRADLEADRKWAAWIAWLTVARDHGGFEAE
jgi:hypothetical protein